MQCCDVFSVLVYHFLFTENKKAERSKKMKKQGRRWIGAILAMLMLVVSLYTDASVTANAATTKASVSFANLPEGNTLKLEDTYKYDFNAKKTGTAKVVYFEVKKGANTAGVQSSNSGIVYPVTAGEFDVRVVAFSSTANRTKWLDARKKNGYVADPSAEKKYVVDASDWETITVTSETEGLGVARSQSALNKVLKNKKVTNVLIKTDAEKTFTIANKNYKGKTLTVEAPKATVINAGRFAQIDVKQIKPATFHEKAKGNKFNITAVNASVIVEKGARILELVYKPLIKAADVAVSGSFNFKLEIKGTVNTVNVAPQKEEGVTEVVAPVIEIKAAENSNISEVKVEKSTALTIEAAENSNISKVNVEASTDLKVTGKKETAINVTVGEKAVNTKLTAEVPVKADLSADTTVTLAEDAKNSEITVSKKVEVEVKAADAEKPVEDVVINVAKEAEGAKLTTEVKVEVKPEANVTIAGSAAADSTITKVEGADDVNVTVEKTDENGNVTTEVVTPTPDVTPAPEVTTTPGGSTGGNGGSTGGNGGGSTTTTEVGAIGAVTYKVAGTVVTVTPTPVLNEAKTAYEADVTIEVSKLTDEITIEIDDTGAYNAVVAKKVEINTTTKKGTFSVALTPKDNTKTKPVNVVINVTVKEETTEETKAPVVKYVVTTGSAVTVGNLTSTADGYTGSVTISSAKKTDKITFSAEGYTITLADYDVKDFTQGTKKSIELELKKDSTTIKVTLSVTITEISEEGQVTPPAETPQINVTLPSSITCNATTVTGSSVTTGTAISATVNNGVVTVTVKAGCAGTVSLNAGTVSVKIGNENQTEGINVQWKVVGGSDQIPAGETSSVSLTNNGTSDMTKEYYVEVKFTKDGTTTTYESNSGK